MEIERVSVLCWSFCTEKSHFSPPLRHHLRTRDHHHPADDQRHGQVPRHAQQRQGVHEASRGAQGPFRTGHGLRRIYVGHDQRH